MKSRNYKWLRIALATFLITLGTLLLFWGQKPVLAPSEAQGKVLEPVRYQPTHQQVVWRYVLEWCESRGVQSAVNPNDLDNTPSYYSFQWKPSTFQGYALKYGILKLEQVATKEQIMEEMKNYDTQVLILNEMIGERENINWRHEFPDCVSKYGLPPSK